MKNEDDIFNKAKGKNPFDVPTEYFNEFPEKIQSRLTYSIEKKSSNNILRKVFYSKHTLVYSIAILLIIMSVNRFISTNNSIEITQQQAYTYLSQLNDDEIPPTLMIEYIDKVPNQTYEPTDEEITDYLLDENLEDLNTN